MFCVYEMRGPSLREHIRALMGVNCDEEGEDIDAADVEPSAAGTASPRVMVALHLDATTTTRANGSFSPSLPLSSFPWMHARILRC